MTTEVKGSIGPCERCGDEARVIVDLVDGKLVLCLDCRMRRRDRRNREKASLDDYC